MRPRRGALGANHVILGLAASVAPGGLAAAADEIAVPLLEGARLIPQPRKRAGPQRGIMAS